MAVAGDVVIKLAADFADFVAGMTESTKQLTAFGAQAEKTGATLSSMFTALKSGIAALGIEQIIAYGDALIKAGAALDTQAQTLGISVEALQAYKLASIDAGQSVETMTSLLARFNVSIGQAAQGSKAHLDALNALGVTILDSNGKLKSQADILQLVAQALLKVPEGAQRAALEIALFGKAGQDVNALLPSLNKSVDDLSQKFAEGIIPQATIDHMVEIQKQSDLTEAKLSKLLSVLYTEVKGDFLAKVNSDIADITRGLQAASAYEGILDKIAAFYGAVGSAQNPQGTSPLSIWVKDAAQLNTDLAEMQTRLTRLQSEGQGTQATTLQKQIADKQSQLDKLNTSIAQATAPVMPAVTATAPTGGSNPPAKGGSGNTDADNIEAQIRRYQALADAAAKAQATISASNAQNVEDLKRQVTVQQQVDDITGKLEAKHIQISAEQKQRLTDAVTGAETQRAAEQKLLDVNVQAEALESKLGDGTVACTKALKDLNLEQETGRVSGVAYATQMKNITDTYKDQQDQATRVGNGLDALGAGFDQAARAYAKANDAFAAGGQVFTGITNAMSESVDYLVGTSTKGFDQIAQEFATMLAKMALQAALSPVFKAIGSGVSSFLSGPTGIDSEIAQWSAYGTAGASSSGGGIFGSIISGISSIFGRATGGPIMPGQPYLVGENGPELIVPGGAGQVTPIAGGSGGVTVNLDMRGQQSTSGTNPQQAVALGRKIKAAVSDVIQNEKLPGGSLYSRVTA
jgi:lambda family phage tail tape measure protein